VIGKKIVKRLASRRRNGAAFYRRFANPDGYEWAVYLREHGGFYHLGEGCTISPDARILDPAYTWIGNRVCIATCTLICHDGAVEILNQRYGVRIDRVAPIILHDDVFVGEAAIILPGVTVGAGSIVGAGAVVRQSVAAGSVVLGNPAKVVAKVEDVVRLWEADTLSLPWADLIEKRVGVYDADMEPELIRRRQEHFFKGDLRRPPK
jgi:acetyltransferase-like isoleucine patch superfamily enzyme